jgi:glyoxylase-like metal-dependent hydrolase (beta-lactamase superfamily II)
MPTRNLACILLLTIAGAVVATVNSAAQSAEKPKQRFEKVADGVYAALPAPGSDVVANSGFVIGKDAVWVYDAMRPEIVEGMIAAIKKLTPAPVKYVINSHHHYEMVLGNSSFPGATIVAHENARKDLIAAPPEAQIARTRANLKRLGLQDSGADEALPPLRLPDLTFTDKLIFHDGEREVQVIHLGRYHTDGDCVLFLPREKVLFSGDLLPGIGGPGGQQEAYFRDFLKSIDKALALDFDVIVPSRGPKLATKQDLRNFRQYLADLISEVQKYVDRGATLEETQKGVKPSAYLDPKRLDTPSFKRLWDDTIHRAYEELKAPALAR